MTDPFVLQFKDLFVARQDIYADGQPRREDPDKKEYFLKREPLTDVVLSEHLRGERCVGVYALVPDNSCRWFAIDFDGPKGVPVEDAFEVSWEAGVRQAKALEAKGLTVYIERSISGRGVHIWGFLEKPMQASKVRCAIRPLLLNHDTFDRMWPGQDELKGSNSVGTLIALPFQGMARKSGFSSFLDAGDRSLVDPRGWVSAVRRNPVAIIEYLAEKAPKISSSRIRAEVGPINPDLSYKESVKTGALKLLSHYGCPFFRYVWLNRREVKEPAWYAAIQLCTIFRRGRRLAHAISRDHPGYTPAETDLKYDQALREETCGYAWLHTSFPELVGLERTAVRHIDLAQRSIIDLVQGAAEPAQHVGSFDEDLRRIDDWNSGRVQAGIKWNIDGLDDYVRLRPSELVVVGGAPSLGKTAFMIHSMLQVAHAGKPVFLFSAETGRTSLRLRMLANEAKVDLVALRGERTFGSLTKEERQRIEVAGKRLSELPIYEDYVSMDAESVLSQIESVVLENNLSLDTPYVIFFDFLQFGLKRVGDLTEYDRLSRLSGEFKALAKILEKTVVLFSQLKREAEGEDDPVITWFKGTGRIETDLDVGLIITGERVFGDVARRKLTIVKQREGIANRSLEFRLHQPFGSWEYDHDVEMVKAVHLFESQEEDMTV